MFATNAVLFLNAPVMFGNAPYVLDYSASKIGDWTKHSFSTTGELLSILARLNSVREIDVKRKPKMFMDYNVYSCNDAAKALLAETASLLVEIIKASAENEKQAVLHSFARRLKNRLPQGFHLNKPKLLRRLELLTY